MIFLAYFLTKLSSLKMKRERLTVRQFCRTGIGLYRAMVRARWAIDCLYTRCAPGGPPCLLAPRAAPPCPCACATALPPPPYRAGASSVNRAILHAPNASLHEAGGKKGVKVPRDDHYIPHITYRGRARFTCCVYLTCNRKN